MVSSFNYLMPGKCSKYDRQPKGIWAAGFVGRGFGKDQEKKAEVTTFGRPAIPMKKHTQYLLLQTECQHQKFQYISKWNRDHTGTNLWFLYNRGKELHRVRHTTLYNPVVALTKKAEFTVTDPSAIPMKTQ